MQAQNGHRKGGKITSQGGNNVRREGYFYQVNMTLLILMSLKVNLSHSCKPKTNHSITNTILILTVSYAIMIPFELEHMVYVWVS